MGRYGPIQHSGPWATMLRYGTAKLLIPAAITPSVGPYATIVAQATAQLCYSMLLLACTSLAHIACNAMVQHSKLCYVACYAYYCCHSSYAKLRYSSILLLPAITRCYGPMAHNSCNHSSTCSYATALAAAAYAASCRLLLLLLA